MKVKRLMGIVLVVVTIAVLGFWHHRGKLVAQPPKAALQAATPRTLTKRVLMHPVKMVTVARVVKKRALNPMRSDWTDVQLIADDRADYEKRLEAIRRLAARLTEADWQVLKSFLLKPDSLDREQLEQVLKNQLMDALCAMNPPPKDLGSVMAAVYQNLLQDEVIRDYAVQHLATLDQTLAEDGGNGFQQEEKVDQQVLWNALGETGDSIAGTALLGLARLSEQQNAQVSQSKIAGAALQLVNDSTVGELTQITAFQICGQLNVQDALPAIEAAAQNGQTISVRISAIGALGMLGGANDISLLEKLLQDNNDRFQLPVKTAIEKINARQN